MFIFRKFTDDAQKKNTVYFSENFLNITWYFLRFLSEKVKY